MTFYNENIDNLQVEISRDFKKVLLVNGSENYILEDDESTIEKEGPPQSAVSPSHSEQARAGSGPQGDPEK